MAAGSIVIDLLMRTGMFETDTKRAEKALEGFQKKAKQVGGAVGTAFAAAGTALAVMVRGAIQDIDQLALMSDQIGVNTEKLSGLRYAAQQMADVSAGTFDTALRRMTRRIAEAADGSGGAVKALKDLGLSAKDLAKLSPDQQFKKLADAMKGADSQAGRLRATMAIFDTEGMPLVNMLREGSAAIEEMEDAAHRLGIVVDDETAAFTKQLKDLTAVKNGLVLRITADVLPTLNALMEMFSGSADAAERLDYLSRVASSGLKLVAFVAAGVAGVFKTLGEYLGGAAAAIVQFLSGNFRQAMVTAFDVWQDVESNLKQTFANMGAIWKGVKVEGTPVKDAADKDLDSATTTVKTKGAKLVDEAARLWQQVEDSIARLGFDLATFGMTDDQKTIFNFQVQGADTEQLARVEAILSATRELKKEEQDRKEAAEQSDREKGVLASLNSEIEALGKSAEWIAKRNALLDAGVEAESEMGQAIVRTVEELYRQGKAIDQTIATMDIFRGEASNALADVLMGTKSLKDGFLDMLDAISQRITQMIAERLIEQLFGQMGTTQTGSSGGWIAALAGMFGGARAGGGDTIPNRPFLVGEQGPELFVPRTWGAIAPAGQTAQMTRGGPRASITQNVQFNVEGQVDLRSRQQIAYAMHKQNMKAARRLS